MDSSYQKNVAIIGVNQESADLFSSFLKTEIFHVVKVLNPELEEIRDILRCPGLDMIVDTTGDPRISADLKRLKLNRTDIMSGLSAHLLYCAGSDELKKGNVTGYRAKILESLHEVRRSVYLAKNKEELLKLVLSIATRSLAADGGSIMLIDPQKRCLSIEMATGLESGVVSSTMQRLGKGIAGRVAMTGKPLLIKGRPEGDLKANLNRTDLVSAICAPLIIGGEVVGVLNINSKNPSRIFDERDLGYLKKLADFTADIIKTSKEYEQSSSTTFSLQLINQVQQILNLEYPLRERLNLVLMRIANTFQGEICNYYHFNKDTQQFLVKASSSFTVNMIKDKLVKLNDFFTSKILKNQSSFCFHLQLTNSGARKWYIAQPVFINDELSGLLFLHLISDRDDLTREKNVLEKVSSLLNQELAKVQSIENSRLQSVKYSAISELTYDFGRINNVRKLAQLVVSNACLIFDAETCVFSLYNENMNSYEVLESFSMKGFDLLADIHQVDKQLALKVTRNGNLVLIPDLRVSNIISTPSLELKSALCMCIKRAKRPIAAISLYNKVSVDPYENPGFTNDDKEVFGKFCLQVSKTLERFLLVRGE